MVVFKRFLLTVLFAVILQGLGYATYAFIWWDAYWIDNLVRWPPEHRFALVMAIFISCLVSTAFSMTFDVKPKRKRPPRKRTGIVDGNYVPPTSETPVCAPPDKRFGI